MGTCSCDSKIQSLVGYYEISTGRHKENDDHERDFWMLTLSPKLATRTKSVLL
jgi:hypothetical protein